MHDRFANTNIIYQKFVYILRVLFNYIKLN